jgi:Na+-driven multidrug efflux pump
MKEFIWEILMSAFLIGIIITVIFFNRHKILSFVKNEKDKITDTFHKDDIDQ